MDWQPLVAAARQARERAYAPHSGYRVGAALLSADGSIHAAGNVENGLLALSVCAERLAVAAAVNAGRTDFRALAVVTDSRPPASPCGLCRQTLAEFVRDLPVLCVNDGGETSETSLGELLPRAFRLDEARRQA
jgi:cytidine deaminase